MRATVIFWLLGALVAGVNGDWNKLYAQNRLAIQNGRILTMAGPELAKGTILIQDGKIQAIGEQLEIPIDVPVLDAAGKVLMPGLILAETSGGMDQTNERNPIVPFLSVVDAIDPSNPYFEESRRNGVTTLLIAPGDATLIGGQAAILKTAGKWVEQMILRREAGLKISLRPVGGTGRMAQYAELRRLFEDTREYLRELKEKEQEKQKTEEKKAEPPAGEKPKESPADKKAVESAEPTTATAFSDATGQLFAEVVATPDNLPLELTTPLAEEGEQPADAAKEAAEKAKEEEEKLRRHALVRLLQKEIPALIYCERAMDVPHALRLIRENELKAILILGSECYKAIDELAGTALPVVLDPELVFWETDPRTLLESKIILPRYYTEAKIPFTFRITGQTNSNLFFRPTINPAVGSNYLWYQAATAVKYGTDRQKALEAITTLPAQFLGVNEFVGSLAVGRDADLLILSGDPLAVTTWVEKTIINGEVVYDRDKDPKVQALLPAESKK